MLIYIWGLQASSAFLGSLSLVYFICFIRLGLRCIVVVSWLGSRYSASCFALGLVVTLL